MQSRITSPGSLDWKALLRTWPIHQRELRDASAASALPEGEQDERIANSKLDRLAAELRALGIQF